MKLFGVRSHLSGRLHYLEPIALVWVLAFVFTMAFLPKDNYRYPLHVDEWFHFTLARSTLETGHTSFENPYFGEKGSRVGLYREAGFHVLLSEVKLVSGVSWLTLFRFMPALVLVAVAFLVYILGRRDGFGLEGAALVGLMPTTLKLLGPSFLVPLGVGLFLTPALLLLYYQFEFSPRSTLLIGLLLLLLLVTHPATGVLHLLLYGVNLAVFALAASIPWRVRLRRAAVVAGAGAVLGVAVLFLLRTEVFTAWALVAGDASPLPGTPARDVAGTLGIMPLSLGVAGLVLWSLSRRWIVYALGASMLGLVIIFAAYGQWSVGEGSVSHRGLMLFYLLLLITGGAGLAVARKSLAKGPWPLAWWAPAMTGVILAAAVLTTIPLRKAQQYYYLINDAVYYDTTWIDQY
ncbi:MAG: hypothetical protein HYY31_03445, partial [Chloroflexi bacterium]|nr:hypothetical protein [Chloroflexota bacterium]